MNHVTLIGRLVRDPEKRDTPSGVSICLFTIAVNGRFTNQEGRKETDFLPIITWRGLADNCANYLHKGSKVAVLGEIRTRSYDTQDGSKRYVTEIQGDNVEFLDPLPKREQGENALPNFDELPDEELPI